MIFEAPEQYPKTEISNVTTLGGKTFMGLCYTYRLIIFKDIFPLIFYYYQSGPL